MSKSHSYASEIVLERQQCQVSIRRRKFLWTAYARVLSAVVFSVLFSFPANAFEYNHRIALLIGLGKYEAGQGKGIFRNLPTVVNDLETVAKALREIGFKEIHIYSDQAPPVGTQFTYKSMLKSDDPSEHINAQHLTDLISDLLSALEKSDEGSEKRLLLIYFTGHGGLLGKSNRVLATPESNVNNPASFSSVYQILEQMADRASSVDKMLVIDACADELNKNGPIAFTKSEEELPVHLYSSERKEASFFDNNLGISIFTLYFAEALIHADDLGIGSYKGIIDSDSIANYVKIKVPLHAEKQPKRPGVKGLSQVQHPWASGSHNIVLAISPNQSLLSPPPKSATVAQKEAYFQAAKNTYYGDSK